MIKFRETDANSYNEVRKAILTPQLNDQYDHGCNLVGDTGDVPPHFFRLGGHNMPCPPTFFSLGFVFGEVSKIKFMFVMFCVKSFSC